jgi:hypothetical protein
MPGFLKYKPIITILLTLSAVGCGLEVESKSENSRFTATLNLNGQNASYVWHDGNVLIEFNSKINQGSKVFLEPELRAEDGNSYEDVLVTEVRNSSSGSAVYGIFQLDLFDADIVTFRSAIGFPNFGEKPSNPVIFRLSVQEGDFFPVLAEMAASYTGELKILEADLSRYRGRSVFLIVSVESQNNREQSVEAIWIDPRINFENF